jgi:hypothetical protein
MKKKAYTAPHTEQLCVEELTEGPLMAGSLKGYTDDGPGIEDGGGGDPSAFAKESGYDFDDILEDFGNGQE